MKSSTSPFPVAPPPALLLELGRGGMGTAYLALTEGPAGFRKLKVVKRLHPELVDDAQGLRMLLDEARLAARLQHPNIVHTSGVGYDGVYHFIEMEYLEGVTLSLLLKRARETGGLSIPVGVWILTQALAGLDYAHDLADLEGRPLRIVHRDVSPNNLVVTYDGAVKVLDFGVAKSTDAARETTRGVVKGKATYMAPEQARGRAVDRRADVFAVGVILWELLAGRRMWEGRERDEIFRDLEEGNIPKLADGAPTCDENLARICDRALRLDPEERWSSAGSMQAALEAWLDRQPTRVSPRVTGELVATMFGDRRASVRSEIEEMMRAREEGRRTTSVLPQLGFSRGPGLTEPHAPASAATPDDAAGESLPDATSRQTPVARLSDRPTVGLSPHSEPRETASTEARSRHPWTAIALVAMMSATVAFIAVRQRSSTPGAPPESSSRSTTAPQCLHDSECVRSLGEPAVCRPWGCVKLQSEDCRVVADAAGGEGDARVWIGVMFPQSGEDGASFGVGETNAIELARRELSSIAHGLPSPRAGAQPRPLGLVVCDDSVDPRRAARHLANEVGVPAVIGFRSSAEVVDLSSSVFIPRDVLVVASINSSALIAKIPHRRDQPRLVWRTTFSTSDTALAAARLIDGVLEPRLRAQPGALGPGATVRVALVRPDSQTGLAFAESFFTMAQYNGKSALANGDKFRELVEGTDATKVVDELAAFEPHVIVYVGDDEIGKSFITPLEARWSARAPFRPLHLLTGVPGTELAAFAEGRPERRRRLFGQAPVSSTVTNTRFVARYNHAFTPPVSATLAPNGSYDAMYLIAYAAIAAGDGPLTGSSLARGIERLLPPGKPIDVGPTAILDAVGELQSGARIDLNGATGALDLDVATGQAPIRMAITCLAADATRTSPKSVESGLVLDPAARALAGTLRCP